MLRIFLYTLGVPLVFVQLPIRADRPAIIRSEYASLAGWPFTGQRYLLACLLRRFFSLEYDKKNKKKSQNQLSVIFQISKRKWALVATPQHSCHKTGCFLWPSILCLYMGVIQQVVCPGLQVTHPDLSPEPWLTLTPKSAFTVQNPHVGIFQQLCQQHSELDGI